MSKLYQHKTCKNCKMPIIKLTTMWTHVMTGYANCQPTYAEPEEEDAVHPTTPVRG